MTCCCLGNKSQQSHKHNFFVLLFYTPSPHRSLLFTVTRISILSPLTRPPRTATGLQLEQMVPSSTSRGWWQLFTQSLFMHELGLQLSTTRPKGLWVPLQTNTLHSQYCISTHPKTHCLCTRYRLDDHTWNSNSRFYKMLPAKWPRNII